MRPSASRRSRVTPGVSSTSAIFRPTSRLNSVDLPTLGRPTMATVTLMAGPSIGRRWPPADPGYWPLAPAAERAGAGAAAGADGIAGRRRRGVGRSRRRSVVGGAAAPERSAAAGAAGAGSAGRGRRSPAPHRGGAVLGSSAAGAERAALSFAGAAAAGASLPVGSGRRADGVDRGGAGGEVGRWLAERRAPSATSCADVELHAAARVVRRIGSLITAWRNCRARR